MPSATEEFRDKILLRQHYLARVQNGTIKELMVPYNTAKQEILAKIESLEKIISGEVAATSTFTLDWRLQRLNAQLAEVNAVLDAAALEASGKLDQTLIDVAFAEQEYYSAMLSNKFATIGVELMTVPYAHVDYAIANPLLGEHIGEKLLWSNAQAVRLMKQELIQSVISGEDLVRASRRLLGNPNIGITGLAGKKLRNRMQMIARSEIQYVSNQVQRSLYNASQEVLKGVQFCATLDRRTCLQCGSLDGRTFNFAEGMADHTGPQIPLHPMCRCCYVPVTKSWKELGANAKEFPPGTRAAFDGQVPATMNYQQWLKTQDANIQKKILGPKRHKLWSDGKVKFDKMATDRRILKVSEL